MEFVPLKLECLDMQGSLYLALALPPYLYIHLVYYLTQKLGFLHCQISALMGGKKPNGMLPNPPWIISIKDYGNSLGISCFVKVYSRATCSLQPYKYDSVTSVPPNSFFFFFFFFSSHFVLQHRASCQDVWGCQHAAVHVDTMCVPCGGAYSKLG